MSILRRRALIAEGGIPYWYNITEDWDYIIDQTGKYENPIIVNEKNLYGNKLTSISSIRNMSKLVVGYYDETSAKLIWSPIDDSSKTIVKCNTPAYPININVSKYISEHPTADVFMKLPEFWWRCWNINNNSDTVAFKFVTDEPTDGNTWNHWDGNIFIGVYKSGTNKVNDVSVLRSISGIPAYIGDSCDSYKTFARNKGAGYRCVTYEAHRIMALLFFGFYGHPNDNEVFGAITSSSTSDKMGTTDAIGINKDDNVVINNNMTTHSYWGLENWCRGNEEHIDNIKTLHYNNNIVKIRILDISGSIKYFFIAPIFSGYSYYISKLLLPEIVIGESNTPYLFKGLSKTIGTSDLGAIRTLQNGGGLVPLDISYLKNRAVSLSTSRLQYEGNNEQNTPSSTTSVISSYVLDQTDSNGNQDTAIVFDNDNSVIFAIKAASDFYACENKDWGTDTPEFIKMSKNHKLTTAGGVLLDANNYDIFMKLPEFWWKYEIVDNNEDKVRFSFTMTNPNDDTWFHWEGDTFIGVYEGYADNDRVYSRSGVIPSSLTSYYADTYIANRGTGFKNINYSIHRIMCILGWGYLANLNYRLGPGRESQSLGITVNNNTGVNDVLGFTDNGYSGQNTAINFWGLEDWWGHEKELLNDIVFYHRRNEQYYAWNTFVEITNDDGTKRTINDVATSSYGGVGKIILGPNIDLVVKNYGNLYNDCAVYYWISSEYSGLYYSHQFARSLSYQSSYYGTNKVYHSGINSIGVPSVIFPNNNTSGCPRLCYKGNYTISE